MFRVSALFVFTISIYCSQLLAVGQQAENASVNHSYIVGVVPQFDIRETKRIWQPILESLEARTGYEFKLEPSPDIPSFEKSFIQGKYDFAYMNPYHAIVANKVQGYVPVLRDISKDLYGVIVVRKDSPISDIRELHNRKIAFPAPNALGAALIPRAEFAKNFRIKPEFSYVRSHDSVYLNTVMGLTDAGGGVMGTLKKQSYEVRSQLRILYETKRVPRHPIVVHPRVDRNVLEKTVHMMLDLANSPKGASILSEVPIGNIGKTSLGDYQPLKDMGLEAFYVGTI